MEQLEHIRYLYEKYLAGDISDVDREKLMQFFRSATSEEIDFLIGGLADVETGSQDLERLNQRTEQVFSRISRYTQPEKRKIWPWISYAAAVLLIIGISIFIYYQRTSNQAAPPKIVKVLKDLAPGGKRATLTLADGSTIVLDSAHTGQLAVVDGTRISKTAGGQLVYQNNAEGTGTVQSNKVSIPRGGEYQLFLPDGTHVWLNAATTITYPTRFRGADRRVAVAGEAYFEVAKDPQHPFIVETDKQEIQVLGTHFNLNTYLVDKTITTLEEGSVRVLALQGTKRSVVIKPGEQVINSNRLSVQPADLEAALAWKNGLLIFRDAPLQNLLEEISRWYDFEVVYKGTPPSKVLSGGVSRSSNLSAVLHILKLTGVKATLLSEGDTKKLLIEP